MTYLVGKRVPPPFSLTDGFSQLGIVTLYLAIILEGQGDTSGGDGGLGRIPINTCIDRGSQGCGTIF